MIARQRAAEMQATRSGTGLKNKVAKTFESDGGAFWGSKQCRELIHAYTLVFEGWRSNNDAILGLSSRTLAGCTSIFSGR